MSDKIEFAPDCADSHVVDRFEELESDMRDGFKGLRNDVENMDADELRRTVSMLEMIGHSQMNSIRSLDQKVDGMSADLIRLHDERTRVLMAIRELMRNMGVAYDPDEDSPAKWIRMAASIANEAEAPTLTLPAAIEQQESMTDRVMVIVMTVLAVCAVVWTVLMVTAWA